MLPAVAVTVLLAAGGTLVVEGFTDRIDAGPRSQAAGAPIPAHTFTVSPAAGASVSADGNEPSAAATATASPPPSGRTGSSATGAANRLEITSLGIDAALVTEPITGNELVIPTNVHQVGVWDGGAALGGSEGTVLLAGHVNYTGQGNGALYPLAGIKAGARIEVTSATGLISSWQVTSLQLVEKAALPQGIFTSTGPRQLVVITCGGPLLHVHDTGGSYNTYQDNVVVTAVPA
jgi:hypothetical protein